MSGDLFVERLAVVRQRFVSTLESKIEDTYAALPKLSGDGSDVIVTLEETYRRIHGIVGELQAHGLVVKRLEGVVDFRSLRGDRPVYLCWRKGESRIDHWHEVSSDFGDRRPVDKLFKPTLAN